MSLALKYRPATFADVAGQRPAAAVLYQMARRNNVPPGLLFTGPRGCGKTSTARILGAALNCDIRDAPGHAWPCGSCPSCKSIAAANGSSLAVEEVDAASHGTVEDIRGIVERLRYGTSGEHKVLILDEVHSASRAGFDALLKELEEPQPYTTFILLTTEGGRVPATIVSRCLPFAFRPVPATVICERLAYISRQEGLGVSDELLGLFAERAEGALRDAVMLLEQAAVAGILTVDDWRKLHGEHDFAPALLTAAASGNHARLYSALDEVLSWNGDYGWALRQLVLCLRDVLVLSAGGSVQAQGAALAARQELAARVSAPAAVDAMRVLWDLQVKVRAEDRRTGMVLALAVLAEKLSPAARPVQAAANGHGKVASLSDLAGAFG